MSKTVYLITDSTNNVVAATQSPSVAFSEVVDVLHGDVALDKRSKLELACETTDGNMVPVTGTAFGTLAKGGSRIQRFKLWSLAEGNALSSARANLARFERAAETLGLEPTDLPQVAEARAAVDAILESEDADDEGCFYITAIPVTVRSYKR